MRTSLRNLWDRLASSLWFVPAVMILAAIGAALGSIRLDRSTIAAGWAFGGGPEGAREVLSAIAASMITVAGVSFSVMIVALTLASQQFGPRLLRNFMRDTGNQIVLGTFIATFTYCLLVLRTIQSGNQEFVPHVSVTLAIVFALASLGVLIYFIHHAAVSIQAPELIATVSRDLLEGVESLFPEQIGESPETDGPAAAGAIDDLFTTGRPIAAAGGGYLQSIADDTLMNLARRHDLVVALLCRPGDFIIAGDELARVHPTERADEDIIEAIRAAFLCGTQRTHLQDLGFTLQQLVEVAVRALSPGINDPFTAMNCIDRIAEALCILARRSFPSALREDEDGRLRIAAPVPEFAVILNEAFGPIRQYGRSSAVVTIRLLEALERIGRRARRTADRRALLEQARIIERGSRTSLPEEFDRTAVAARFRSVLLALGEGAASGAHGPVARLEGA